MTRFVCISDTHEKHRKMAHPLPEGDVLIHAGDLVNYRDAMMNGVLHDCNAWFRELSRHYKLMVFVPGNHDQPFEEDWSRAHAILSEGVPNLAILRNTVAVFGRFKIYGQPQTPFFMDWAFNVQPSHMKLYTDAIPGDTNILVSHGPPRDIMDRLHTEPLPLGCPSLRERVFQVQPELHVFGHIHDSYGTWNIRRLDTNTEMRFVNAAICDETYEPVNAPIIIDLP